MHDKKKEKNNTPQDWKEVYWKVKKEEKNLNLPLTQKKNTFAPNNMNKTQQKAHIQKKPTTYN